MNNIENGDSEDRQRDSFSKGDVAKETEGSSFLASSEDQVDRREIEIFTPQELDLDFNDLTVEALEQRLELAVGKIVLPGPLENCVNAFDCGSFGCTTFTCGGTFS